MDPWTERFIEALLDDEEWPPGKSKASFRFANREILFTLCHDCALNVMPIVSTTMLHEVHHSSIPPRSKHLVRCVLCGGTPF